MGGAVRRFDAERRRLTLSEVLRPGSRNFQMAHVLGLLSHSSLLDELVADEQLSSEESRSLCRVAFANYFAGAVLMPYDLFLDAARTERYDIELLSHRFNVSFEQVAHRLTTLQRPGNRGVPLHLVRIDIAGNISKRFSASGLRFARFSASCPLWNVHAAFRTPGRIRVQLSRMPNGDTFLCAARTLRRGGGGYSAPEALQALSIGCDVSEARALVYSDGIDLESEDRIVKVGVTCQLCERPDCPQRAVPPIHQPLRIDENVRGVSFFSEVS
jgi:predicted transcriptional regulator